MAADANDHTNSWYNNSDWTARLYNWVNCNAASNSPNFQINEGKFKDCMTAGAGEQWQLQWCDTLHVTSIRSW
jgi:hypothetical protein